MVQKTKKFKRESLVLGKILKKIAPRIGATVVLEPEWNIAGQILFKNGRRSYFRYNSLDLNPVGASEIAKDKDYANFFMKKMGYPVIPKTKTFFSDEWADLLHVSNKRIGNAYAYAKSLGFPVVIKPNSGSQGIGFQIVHTKEEFYTAMRASFMHDKLAIVQPVIQGRDYRIVVLDDKIISAYERIPLSVVGDGRSSIQQLLTKKQKEFVKAKRDTFIKIKDPRMVLKLAREKRTFRSVLPKGEKIFLLDNANLSSGGDSIDVTKEVHPLIRQMAINLTKDMGLRLCGVDVMIEGDISKPGKYHIIEINSAPGLDHYAKVNKEQEKVVEELYTKVLKSLSQVQ